MKKLAMLLLIAAIAGTSGTSAFAQQGMGGGMGQGPRGQSPGTGPVAAQCQKDIETLCAGKEHGSGAVRDCLEANKAKVSDACKAALDTTGMGRRQ